MRKIVSIFLLVVLCSACSQKENEKVKPGEDLLLEYKLIATDDPLGRKGWGYEVYVNKEGFIRQPTIPAIGGERVFTTQEDAAKTAKLVLEKIREKPNDFPAINVKELDRLGIINLAKLYAEVYQQSDGGWGLRIMLDQLPVAKFDSFYGFDNGLRTKDDAEKVGVFIIAKMQQYKPGVVEAEELIQLGIN